MPNHSFAILAYQNSPFLADCIHSSLSQTIQSEIYICTSTPSDYINSIANKYGIELFIAEASKGIANDWNFALHKSKTKFVTLAHQDDLYDPRYAEQCLSAAQKFTDTLICFTGYDEIVGEHKRSNTIMLIIKKIMQRTFMPFSNHIHNRVIKRLFLSTGNPIACPTVMYNMKLLTAFKFSSEYSVSLDWEAWIRMAEMKGKFVFVRNYLVHHRIHAGSATTNAIVENKRHTEDFKMFRKMWPDLIARLLTKLYSKSYSSNDIS